jgi:hypothetical protein
MIDTVLLFLRDELNSYIAARPPLPPSGGPAVQVRVTRMLDDNGRYAFPEDSLGLSLINFEEDRTFKAQLPSHTYVDGQHVVRQPELQLTLHAIIAARFAQYDSALKYLSHVMTFFQARAAFTPDTHPALDPLVEKITVELESLSYEQLNQVWAFVGAKQLPSAVYRVRMIVLQDREPVTIGPPIRTIGRSVAAI